MRESDSRGNAHDANAAARRAQRLEELTKDPSKGANPKAKREAEVGLRLEEAGQLAPPITRDPSGAAEFIDGKGVLWDVKQFHSELGRFKLSYAVSCIHRELKAGENVILDTKFLDPGDILLLRRAIEANGWENQILWSVPDQP